MVIIAEASEYDEGVALAEDLMEKEDYRGVILETKKVLEMLEPHLPTIAQAAILQGRAIMTEQMSTMEKTGEPPPRATLQEAWEAYELSQMLDPDCQESEYELKKLANLLRQLPPPDPPSEVEKADYDVIIVGAGAAGIGTALMLTETFGIPKSSVLLLERGEEVATSFRRWPKEMKFISPSFNQQGWTNSFDLNAVTHGTSPAYSLHAEHPSGEEYAMYLEAIVDQHELNVKCLTEVVEIKDKSFQKKKKTDDGEEEDYVIPFFSVDVKAVEKTTEDNDKEHDDGIKSTKRPKTSQAEETLTARYIVWAAGEFQYPKGDTSICKSNSCTSSNETPPTDDEPPKEEMPGASLCLHNSQVSSWAKLPGSEYLVIGGYESGIDACINLSRAGKQCKVLSSTPCWSTKTKDPSMELAPYTIARLRDCLSPGFSPHPQLFAPVRVNKIEKVMDENGGYKVTAEWKAAEDEHERPNLRDMVNEHVEEEQQGEEGSTVVFHTPNPPILATGFEGSVAAAASHLFDFASNSDSGDDGDDADAGEKEEKKDSEMKDMEEHSHDDHSHHERKGCLEGAPLLNENDESTKVPGVFLVGPAVSHGTLSFCFVYKFRQRFAIVAKAICDDLGRDTRAAVSECRTNNMFMDDFSCCEDTCGDVC